MNNFFDDIGFYLITGVFYLYLLTTDTFQDAVYSFFDDINWLVNNF